MHILLVHWVPFFDGNFVAAPAAKGAESLARTQARQIACDNLVS